MIDRKLEAAIITHQDRWPGTPLNLKQRPKAGERTGVMGYAAFGVMTSSRLPLVVYLRPAYVNQKSYASVDALLDDGWIVD